MNTDKTPWPTELRLSADRKTLKLAFEDGVTASVGAEILRVNSPSAEVQGHNAAGKKLLAGKAQVRIERIEPVGNYAVRLVFDDAHDTGLFSWALLHEFATRGTQMQQEYEAEIARRGWSR